MSSSGGGILRTQLFVYPRTVAQSHGSQHSTALGSHHRRVDGGKQLGAKLPETQLKALAERHTVGLQVRLAPLIVVYKGLCLHTVDEQIATIVAARMGIAVRMLKQRTCLDAVAEVQVAVAMGDGVAQYRCPCPYHRLRAGKQQVAADDAPPLLRLAHHHCIVGQRLVGQFQMQSAFGFAAAPAACSHHSHEQTQRGYYATSAAQNSRCHPTGNDPQPGPWRHVTAAATTHHYANDEGEGHCHHRIKLHKGCLTHHWCQLTDCFRFTWYS